MQFIREILVLVPSVHAWSISKKRIIFFVSTFLSILLCYYGFIVGKRQMLQLSWSKISQLKDNFQTIHHQYVNVEHYRKEMTSFNQIMQDLVREFPVKHQIQKWLSDFSQIAALNGVEISLIKPGASIEKEVYAELPIEVILIGSFPKLARFLQELAHMERIVTVHDFSLKKQSGSDLIFKLNIKVYSSDGL